MMTRSLARALQRVQVLSRLLQGEILQYRLHNDWKVLSICNPAVDFSRRAFHSRDISRYINQNTTLFRALSTPAENDYRVSPNAGGAGPLLEYERRIASGELVDGDNFQVGTIQALQRLYEELVEQEESCQLDRYSASKKSGRSRWLWSRFIPQSSYSLVKGLYMYGGVGTGKTMLMDLFFEELPSNWRKKRIHFHDFMLNIHSRLQMHKGVPDPLEVVAGEISDESILLCLDEFMVTDVADALILNRLFGHLFSKGVVLVSTSNRAPDHLYEGGLQRDLFLPFIETLKERCAVHAIGSATDYRKMGSAEKGFYFIGNGYTGLLKQKFHQLIGDEKPGQQVVEVVMGRKLQVPIGASGCAYFPFEELCDRPLGAADYFGLFKNFHTLALEGVPKFGIHNRTAAYRFVTLVDVMYENKARLLCTAEASPLELFESIVTVADAQKLSPRTSSRSQKKDDLDLCVDNELGFAKDRTISRLTEMNSREFLEQHEARLQEKASQEVHLDGHFVEA
ncbi:lactation elevated protein 1-like [Canna indica]|uniref:Lactation elevated protein 1-like n=1 Tax=Canna indica TaxID=4628 RepID=A0AAQ3QL19_9LILI|nr:lactation elevated protein 1-like [Canna indica]